MHFAAFKNHIGFYPGADGVEHFLPRLGAYKLSKGTIQFPLNRPIPFELVAEITRYRVQADKEQHERRKEARKQARTKI